MSSSEEELTDDIDRWEKLINDQTGVFKRVSSRNRELEARVEELEQELSVWKAALKSANDETKLLSRTVAKLERNIGSFKDNNTLTLCLIDGDGHIFSPELISLGQSGGHQAAMLLTKGLTGHLTDIDSPSRGQIWLTIYCNKTGLLETLENNGVCSPEQFEAFVVGFNQASPLFSFVDVGTGKERADEKIKECLRIFTRFPQIMQVFFGGSHDNGYTSTLNYLQNEGLLQKIIILRGYKDLAFELKSLNLPSLEIDGLFMKKKLQTFSKFTIKGLSYRKSPVNTQQNQDLDIPRLDKAANLGTPSLAQRILPPVKGTRPLDPNFPLHKQRPAPCNFHYLAECRLGYKCRYSHDYLLYTNHIDELRFASARTPCPFVNRGSLCPYGEGCCMAHMCPRGRKCSHAKQGKCKFIGDNMHDHEIESLPSRPRSRGSASSPPSIGSPILGSVPTPFSSVAPRANSGSFRARKEEKFAVDVRGLFRGGLGGEREPSSPSQHAGDSDYEVDSY